jgi:Putative peptidoglycan binding domain
MTLTMADSIVPGNLPPGYDAYLGYTDGRWPDFQAEVARFPGKHVLGLAVTAADDAEGLDVENYDATPDQAPAWVQRQLARHVSRPVIYASASAKSPGGGMPAVLTALAGAGIVRSAVRLLSAHYGAGEHICGPGTCGLVHIPMDGTQWTDSAAGVGGAAIDASVLADDFFGTAAPAPTSWQETMMLALPLVKQGETGAPVRTVQGLLMARGYSVTLDGVFGPATDATVKRFQGNSHLSADGIVGPLTWRALMDV